MGGAWHGAGQEHDVPFGTHDRRQDLDQRRQSDADLSALCRAGDQAHGQAGRRGEARRAAVLHRSRRHGAGAERFPYRAGFDQSREIARDNHRDYREAESNSLQSKAGALRDFQTATADLAQARADLRTAESALEAARNRLAILGKTDAEIAAFQEQGKISSDTPIYAPLSGTVVQRKIGPGQYVSYTGTGAVDPVFTIGDLSTVWLVAYVRESEAPKVRIGQQLDFTVLAYPKTTFKANIDHVAASLDPSIRRLLVRATIDNSNGQFKPEMFTSVTIYTDEGDSSIAVPRDAVIYEADNARVWVARTDKTIEVRQIKTGITRGGQIQVLQGLQPGEIVVTKGSLFVDQAAGS